MPKTSEPRINPWVPVMFAFENYQLNPLNASVALI